MIINLNVHMDQIDGKLDFSLVCVDCGWCADGEIEGISNSTTITELMELMENKSYSMGWVFTDDTQQWDAHCPSCVKKILRELHPTD